MSTVRLTGIGLLAVGVAAQGWRPPELARFELVPPVEKPIVSCTPPELERLRGAWKASGALHRGVASLIERAEAALASAVTYPPRGGQHNQWYQCEACQIDLVTVDDTHHRCRRCRKVYSGSPYDDVIYARRHRQNLGQLHDAAWAWAITGEERYAVRAREILLGYADRYRRYPYHDSRLGNTSKAGGKLAEQTLTEASAFSSLIAPAYDLLCHWLSPDDRSRICDGLILPMLKNIDKHRAGKSNWQTWHNAAFVWGGAVLGDARWVRKGIEQKGNGFLSQMETSVTPEGMWYENSWGYHFYTLRAMVLIAEGCRRLGIDLWGHPQFLKMFTVPVRYTMADASLPRFGDDVQSSVFKVTDLLEPAYRSSGDPAILSLLPAKPNFASILLGRNPAQVVAPLELSSEVFPGAGHAMLRNPKRMTAALTFGPFGGFHGHFDKLSFVFFAQQSELAVDPGRAASQAYRLPIHRDWYRATLSHNTVVVDSSSQEGTAGELTLFATSDRCTAVAARVDKAHRGISHERLLVLMPDYLLVLDELRSKRRHRYDWWYHARAAKVECAMADEDFEWPEGYPGTEYTARLRGGRGSDPFVVSFVGAEGRPDQRLTVAAGKGTQVTIGDGPGASVNERIPLCVLTRVGMRQRFAVVVEPVSKGGTAMVSGATLTSKNGALQVVVQRGEQEDRISYRPGGGRIQIESQGELLLSGSGNR